MLSKLNLLSTLNLLDLWIVGDSDLFVPVCRENPPPCRERGRGRGGWGRGEGEGGRERGRVSVCVSALDCMCVRERAPAHVLRECQ